MNANLDTSRQAARDEQLEREINAACQRMVNGKTEEEKRAGWTDMSVLIRRRSSTQIIKMELELRLLRKPQ